MLQGNPFETELVVQERIAAVRNGIDPQPPHRRDLGKVRHWWARLVSAVRPPSDVPRRLQPAEDKS
jgi:hypothetical protein